MSRHRVFSLRFLLPLRAVSSNSKSDWYFFYPFKLYLPNSLFRCYFLVDPHFLYSPTQFFLNRLVLRICFILLILPSPSIPPRNDLLFTF
ncbi:hypothetical protein C8J57DRAFT_1287900 [Mycena rebaudengoi]|nr:hypothetical protein C8J57DRAFT_1287900 [Mycena rebaudengoi]